MYSQVLGLPLMPSQFISNRTLLYIKVFRLELQVKLYQMINDIKIGLKTHYSYVSK